MNFGGAWIRWVTLAGAPLPAAGIAFGASDVNDDVDDIVVTAP